MQRFVSNLRHIQKFNKRTSFVPSLTCSFSTVKNIKPNEVHQTGIRWQEMEAEKEGKVAFNEQSIVPEGDQGTFDNPILVPSQYDFRFVGFEDPASHQVQWFELQQGHPHYVPDIGLYFQLQHTPNTLPHNDMIEAIHHSSHH